jgi:hypothetical protein
VGEVMKWALSRTDAPNLFLDCDRAAFLKWMDVVLSTATVQFVDWWAPLWKDIEAAESFADMKWETHEAMLRAEVPAAGMGVRV